MTSHDRSLGEVGQSVFEQGVDTVYKLCPVANFCRGTVLEPCDRAAMELVSTIGGHAVRVYLDALSAALGYPHSSR